MRRNLTSTIRRGLDYEEAWGLYLSAQWMLDPKKYKWIWFQVTPKEVKSGRFYLDDIILCDQSDSYHLYQIKHKQHPESVLWDWNDLVNPQRDAKESLIEKWFSSYFQENLAGKVEYAAFVTNGSAADEVKNCMIDERIDVGIMETTLPDIYNTLTERLNDEEKMRTFFSNFRFKFGQRSVEEFESETREFLYRELGATVEGVNSLILNIQKECRKEYTVPVNL